MKGKHILSHVGKHIFGTVKVGEKGQIVIPKEAREIFGISPGDSLLILGDENSGIIISPPDIVNDAAKRVFDTMEKGNKE